MVSIGNISFSAPTYRVAPKQKPIKLSPSFKGGKLTITGKPQAACKKAKCTITIYKAGATAFAKLVKLGSAKSTATGGLSVSVAKSKLPGHTPFINIRSGKKLLSSVRARL